MSYDKVQTVDRSYSIERLSDSVMVCGITANGPVAVASYELVRVGTQSTLHRQRTHATILPRFPRLRSDCDARMHDCDSYCKGSKVDAAGHLTAGPST